MSGSPSSEVLAREEYPFGNPFDPSRRGYRVALVYPNTYAIGMSNLGFQQVYRLLNLMDGVVCERFFLPAEEGKGTIQSLERGAPLGGFDLIVFSLASEMDYLNVLRTLGAAGVPLRREARGPGHPLVMVVGSCPSSNPEPLASFFDSAVIGEVEEVLGEVMAILREGHREGREGLFQSLARVEGVYLPSAYEFSSGGGLGRLRPRPGFPERIRRRQVRDLDGSPSASWVLTQDAPFSDLFLIEIARESGWGGSSQAADSSIRSRSLESLVEDIRRGLRYRKRIGFVGTLSHPQLSAICRRVVEMGGQVSPGPFRMDALSDELLDCVTQGGERSLTLVLGAGSERMRFSLGEEVPDLFIFERVEEAFSRGIWNLKINLPVGLPGEADSDVAGVAQMAKRISHLMVKASRGQRRHLKLCVHPFVPRPHTPMQWEPMAGLSEIKRKLKLLSGLLKGTPSVRLTHDVPKWSYVQTLLARGDRRVGEILLQVHERGGDWESALRDSPLNPDFYVTRRWSYEEPLPWDPIDSGLYKDFLVLESQRYRRALGESAPSPRKRALATLGIP